MEYTQFGRTSLHVSKISYGTWQFGGDWGHVEREQWDAGKATVRKALDVNACVILRPNNFDPPVIFFPKLTLSKILTPSFSHTAVRCGSPALRQVVSTWTLCGGRLAPRRANEG